LLFFCMEICEKFFLSLFVFALSDNKNINLFFF